MLCLTSMSSMMHHAPSYQIGDSSTGDQTLPAGYSLNTHMDVASGDLTLSQLTPPPVLKGELPPTPPTLNPAIKLRGQGDHPKPAHPFTLNNGTQRSDMGNPASQIRPPTPEQTPPKNTDFLTPRPAGTLRNPSPQTDSFKTAREEQCSSDGDASIEHSLLNCNSKSSRMLSWLDSASYASMDNTQAQGNGTFWEDITPQLSQHSLEKPYINAAGGDLVEREWDHNLMRNVTVRRKRPRTAGQIQTKDALRHSTNVSLAVSAIESSLEAERQRCDYEALLRNSYGSSQLSRAPDMFAYHRRDSDPKRFSGSSGTSTVVEAVVVDTSPPVSRRLRHVGKNLDLRDELWNTNSVARHSLELNDAPARRLSHKKNMIPHPQWSNNTSPQSAISKPFVNLRSKGDRSQSLSVKRFDGISEPVDITKTNAETNLSVVTFESTQDVRAVSDPLPLRGFPVLQELDRADNTSSSLIEQESPLIPRSDIIEEVIPPSGQESPTDPSRPSKLRHVRKFSNKSEEDGCSDRRQSVDRSTIVTDGEASAPLLSPHSALTRSADRSSFGILISPTSLTSATPEALEISEAKAVPLYTHHNNSLFVVENAPITVPRQQTFMLPPSPPLNRSNMQEIFTTEPATTNMATQTHGGVNSPLPKTHEAPITPVVTIIPPTPARDLERLEAELPNQTSSQISPPKRRPSLLDRARRYSDTFVAPFATLTPTRRGLGLRKSQVQPHLNGLSQQDHNLHPLWRPRHFWDDSDSEFDEDFYDDYSSPFDDEHDRLPAGGDTSDIPEDPEPTRGTVNNVSHSWKRMNSVKGFLIGNSLGLERGPTNKRRHIVKLPDGKRVKRTTAYEGNFSGTTWTQTNSARSEVRESVRRSGSRAKRPNSERRLSSLGGFLSLTQRIKERSMRREAKRREMDRAKLRRNTRTRFSAPLVTSA